MQVLTKTMAPSSNCKNNFLANGLKTFSAINKDGLWSLTNLYAIQHYKQREYKRKHRDKSLEKENSTKYTEKTSLEICSSLVPPAYFYTIQTKLIPNYHIKQFLNLGSNGVNLYD